MSKNTYLATPCSLMDTSALMDSLNADEFKDDFVEIPLENDRPAKANKPESIDDGLDCDAEMFEDKLEDPRKVCSHTISPPQKQKLVLAARSEDRCGTCCHPRNCCVGTISSLFLVAQKVSLTYVFMMREESWAYAVGSGLLFLSFLDDYLLASSRTYDLLKRPKNSLNLKALYQKGEIPSLPINEGKYGIAQMLSSAFGLLAKAVLFGWAEASILSGFTDSLTLSIAFCIVGALARIVDELEAQSVATLSCALLASDSVRASAFPALFVDAGAGITHYRDYFSILKPLVSVVVCCFIVASIELPTDYLANTLWGGAVVFLGLWALMGDNYRTNRLNIEKKGLVPKGIGEKVVRQVLNLALPYQLMDGMTSIYRKSLSGAEKAFYVLPPLVLVLSIVAGALALMESTGINLIGDLSLNGLLLGVAATMGCLALLSFIRARYENAVSLVTGNAYDSLLSAYWMMRMSQHPVAKMLLETPVNDEESHSLATLFGTFVAVMLTTSHTKYYIGQIIATRILANEKKTRSKSSAQVKPVSQSFNSPASWRGDLFRQKSGSTSRAATLAAVSKRLDFDMVTQQI